MRKALIALHTLLAAGILCIYPYYLVHLEKFSPKMVAAFPYLGLIKGAHAGILLFFSLPIIAIIFFLFPKWITRRFSPRTDLLREPLLTSGFWYFIGDLLLFIWFSGYMAYI